MKDDAELTVAHPAVSLRPPKEDSESVNPVGLRSPVQGVRPLLHEKNMRSSSAVMSMGE